MSTPRGPLCTIPSLVRDFINLGIQPGSIVLLHSSLRSLGFVIGGAEAVIRALLDVLGPGGTLVVPTHTGDNSEPSIWQSPPVPPEWWPVIRENAPAYDPQTARTRGMGVLAETLRNWPGAMRSAHPQTSFAALGPEAAFITSGHAVDCQLGEKSPLARLEDLKAKVLLLGVGFDVCTAFHLAEYRIDSRRRENSFAVTAEDGSRRWMTVQDLELTGDEFAQLGAEFERDGHVDKGAKIGGATAKLFRLDSAVQYAECWLRKQRGLKDGKYTREP